VLLAQKCGFDEAQQTRLGYGALLHDIGKIAIPDSILLKPARLGPEEYRIVKQHCKFGYEVLSRVPRLREAATLALLHHERWDGEGYPMRLKANDIPVEARIFAVADTLDVIVSGRPYCSPRSLDEARAEITSCSGQQFDQDVVDRFLAIRDEEWHEARAAVARDCERLAPLLQKPVSSANPFPEMTH
jgi:putative two-component system response regulator